MALVAPENPMGYFEFGKTMLGYSDHDFSHVAMANAAWTRQETDMVFLAYRFFMHIGTACWIADAGSVEGFWQRLEAEYDTLPRKIDRHQTRGVSGWRTINQVRAISDDPSKVLDFWYPDGATYTDVYPKIMAVHDWGKSNAWHNFDMAERTLPQRHLRAVTLREAELYMYDYPWEVLATYVDENYQTSSAVAARMLAEFDRAGVVTPPFGDRPISMQELETVLCRYRKYRKGGYVFGKDKKTVIKNLLWRPSRLANLALEASQHIGYPTSSTSERS